MWEIHPHIHILGNTVIFNMSKILKKLKNINSIDSINFYELFFGSIIFGIFIVIILNFPETHDPMCLGMDGLRIPIDECYWTEEL